MPLIRPQGFPEGRAHDRQTDIQGRGANSMPLPPLSQPGTEGASPSLCQMAWSKGCQPMEALPPLGLQAPVSRCLLASGPYLTADFPGPRNGMGTEDPTGQGGGRSAEDVSVRPSPPWPFSKQPPVRGTQR